MNNSMRALSPPLPPDPKSTSFPQSMPRTQSAAQIPLVANMSNQQPVRPEPRRSSSSNTTATTSTSAAAAVAASVSRPRSVSASRPIIHQPQPIRDAVDRAFDQSIDQSPATDRLDAAFIAQVTEAVVKNLVNANLAGTASQPSAQYPPPPPPATQPAPRSPTQSSTASMPMRCTPPSPYRERERFDSFSSYGSPSPERPLSDSGKDSVKSSDGDRSGNTPKPASQNDGSLDDLRRSNTNRSRGSTASDVDQTSYGRGRNGSDPSYTLPSDRRDSQDSIASSRASKSRAKPTRVPSSVDESDDRTTLEKIWQPLFDKNNNPTPRMGQFLRGLAQHINNDYEPKGSLVITPAKMLRFLDETKIHGESYPWKTIFGGSITCNSIGVMFRRLLCQHHLVQLSNHEAPNVPALTPHGFEWFMLCLIQAHPDTGFERLSKAVMHMPISNADDPKERFPKELSRRLLPLKPNSQAEQRLIASMAHEPLIQLKNSAAMPPPPASAPPASAPPRPASVHERERMPYARSAHSNTVEDADLGGPTVQIERERKPYTARGGAGKVYDSDTDHEDRDRPSTSQYRPDSSASVRSSRHNSIPPSSFHSNTSSDPRNIPAPNRPRMATVAGAAPASLSGYARGSAGRRSPPMSSSYNIGDGSASQYPPGLHPAAKIGTDHHDDEVPPSLRRYAPTRRQTSSTAGAPGVMDDEPRGNPIPSRPGAGTNGYDSGYGSMGQPPSLPPLGGSSYNRPRPTANGANPFDDRRRSAYANGSAAGGTDGWGSFTNGYPTQQGYNGTSGH